MLIFDVRRKHFARRNPCILIVVLSFLFFSFQEREVPTKPNILVIMADDLGFSDLGCFGSEIATPNIDALARQGQLFSNFYTAATCSPSRAMLLTGTDHHIAGFGNMAERVVNVPEQVGKPGYEGYLNNRVVTVAQLLKDAGYHTYMAGKWHLGLLPEHSPSAKGFERSFALLDAYAEHFNPDTKAHPFWEDGAIATYPAGEFSSDVYTDKLVSFIKKNTKDNRPFFMYAAYTAPHWPLQAPLKFIEKYRHVYDIGYDSLRILRFEALKEKSLVPKHVKLPALPLVKGNLYNISDRPLLPWKSLDKSQQRIEARKMEIYAGMIDNLDYNIGRLINYLKEIGQYENTLIVFLSDNGPDIFEFNDTRDKTDPYNDMGTTHSFIAYGAQWAHASSAVNRLYKGYSSEGGIHCPLIIKMPYQKEGRGIIRAFTTIMDLTPTFLDLAGTEYPKLYKGRSIAACKGESMLPLLTNKKTFVHKKSYAVGWELFGRCALRKGSWKIVKIEPPFGTGVFQLFNIENDPTESNDLSHQYRDKYNEMLNEWKIYVKENGVILTE